MLNLNMPNQIKSTTSSKMSCGTDHLIIILLQLVLFVLLCTTTLVHYSYGSLSLANNYTNQHFAGNNSRFVTLDRISAGIVMDLQGSINEGSYQVTLRLGQPAQEYSFMIDTGSHLTWVNCHKGNDYHYPHQPYRAERHKAILCEDPICNHVEHSAGFECGPKNQKDLCSYEVNYLDGTISSGNIFVDSFSIPFTNTVPSLQHPSIKFGCGFHQLHPAKSRRGKSVNHDGVLGLGKKSPTTIVRQLANHGIIRSIFGHCMARPENGYFFMGAAKVLPPAFTWAPMVKLRNENHYSPGPANLLFDGRHTSVTNLQTIFDSGSSLSYFNSSALEAIINYVKENLVKTVAPLSQIDKDGFPICWKGSKSIRSVDEVAVYFKTMTLTFPAANNVQFELPPYTYLVVEPSQDNPNVGIVCFGIHDAKELKIRDVNIIGEIFFQNKLVIYDLDREKIGWAPSNCEYRRMNDRKRRHMNDWSVPPQRSF